MCFRSETVLWINLPDLACEFTSMGVREPSVRKLCNCYRKNNLLSSKPPCCAAVALRCSLCGEAGEVLRVACRKMQTSGSDLAVLARGHADFQDSAECSQFAFLRCVAWSQRRWGRTLLVYPFMWILCQFPFITDITAGRKKKVDGVFCPQTGVNHAWFKRNCS